MTTPDGSLARRLRALAGPAPLRVVASGNHATPTHALELVDAAVERYRLFMLNAQAVPPPRAGVVHETPFVGPAVRDLADLEYLPVRLSLAPKLFQRSRPPDVVVLHTTRPRGGRVSLGIEVNILPSAIEAVRARGGLVIAQANRCMPWTVGDSELDAGLIDAWVDADSPLPTPPARPGDDVAATIGERVAGLVADRSTLQLGIGQIPDAVVSCLCSHRDLRIWSEMVSDGVLGLERCGSLERSAPVTASFLFGSPELYAWADRNPRLVLRRTEVVNDPARIAAQPAMTSINTALEVDLDAQANASFLGPRVYSGFGGQPDFTVGALHSTDGQAIIAVRSWHDRAGASTVVDRLRTPVTSFQHTAVVSEHGTARLFGTARCDQAERLVGEVADPRARPGLLAALEQRRVTGDGVTGGATALARAAGRS